MPSSVYLELLKGTCSRAPGVAQLSRTVLAWYCGSSHALPDFPPQGTSQTLPISGRFL